jgi:hypothetical protein
LLPISKLFSTCKWLLKLLFFFLLQQWSNLRDWCSDGDISGNISSCQLHLYRRPALSTAFLDSFCLVSGIYDQLSHSSPPHCAGRATNKTSYVTQRLCENQSTSCTNDLQSNLPPLLAIWRTRDRKIFITGLKTRSHTWIWKTFPNRGSDGETNMNYFIIISFFFFFFFW